MKMLGKVRWSLHNHAGHPCGECESGWPVGTRRQKRKEERAWRRTVRWLCDLEERGCD